MQVKKYTFKFRVVFFVSFQVPFKRKQIHKSLPPFGIWKLHIIYITIFFINLRTSNVT